MSEVEDLKINPLTCPLFGLPPYFHDPLPEISESYSAEARAITEADRKDESKDLVRGKVKTWRTNAEQVMEFFPNGSLVDFVRVALGGEKDPNSEHNTTQIPDWCIDKVTGESASVEDYNTHKAAAPPKVLAILSDQWHIDLWKAIWHLCKYCRRMDKSRYIDIVQILCDLGKDNIKEIGKRGFRAHRFPESASEKIAQIFYGKRELEKDATEKYLRYSLGLSPDNKVNGDVEEAREHYCKLANEVKSAKVSGPDLLNNVEVLVWLLRKVNSPNEHVYYVSQILPIVAVHTDNIYGFYHMRFEVKLNPKEDATTYLMPRFIGEKAPGDEDMKIWNMVVKSLHEAKSASPYGLVSKFIQFEEERERIFKESKDEKVARYGAAEYMREEWPDDTEPGSQLRQSIESIEMMICSEGSLWAPYQFFPPDRRGCPDSSNLVYGSSPQGTLPPRRGLDSRMKKPVLSAPPATAASPSELRRQIELLYTEIKGSLKKNDLRARTARVNEIQEQVDKLGVQGLLNKLRKLAAEKPGFRSPIYN